MNKQIYFFSALFGLLTASLYAAAQDKSDALRYSYLSTQGTARSIGIGGALGSIGGDFSSLSVNPAGIGVYRTSEFVFTPGIRINGTNSSYNGGPMLDENATRFTIPNAGVIFTSAATGRRYERSKWKSFSFGFGINRVADFNHNYVYSGPNNTSSATEVFAYDANLNPNAINELGSLGALGYDAYLLDEDSLGFFSVVDFNQGLNQRRTVREKGSMTDIVVSFGGNYQEKLLLGATIGIPSVTYRREAVFDEDDVSGIPDNFFDYFTYGETLTTKGSGINLKLGFIYKATDQFRLGLALHTPTYFSFTDEQSQYITSNTENFKTVLGEPDINPITTINSADLPLNIFEYNMITPWRTVLSASTIIGKLGFVTLDYEFVDYASTRFRYSTSFRDAETEVNNSIRNTYKGGHNIRLGGEAKLDIVMVRLGLGYYSSPFQAYDASRMDISTGVGFRFDSWFIDLGFLHSRYNRQEQPYDLSPIGVDVPRANIEYNLNNVVMTLGFKF